MSQLKQSQSGYDYRLVRAGDRERYLDLHETVWGHERTNEWFDWRFRENPYVDGTPIAVAEHDGELVGAEPCLAFRLRVGTETTTALQPADWAVHPDHRKLGVFFGMTERLLEAQTDGPAQLYFNFPNEHLVPGLETFDWTIRDGPTTHYRIQNPERVVRLGSGSKREFTSVASGNLGRLVTPLARGYLQARDRLRGSVDGVSVERAESIPVGLLTTLTRHRDDGPVHVVRDAAYYRWRFANPRWETTTYVARRDGCAVAACLTCSEQRGKIRSTAVLDVVPRDASVGRDVYRALLEPILADANESDVVKVGEWPIPASVLRTFGFRANDRFPIAAFSNSTALAVRPTTRSVSEGVEIGGVDPTEHDWELQLADQDIA